jgi:hypothetical protein
MRMTNLSLLNKMNKLFILVLFLVLTIPLTLSVSQRSVKDSLKRIVSAQSFEPTVLHFTIFLDGIGNSGDSTNPDSIGSNKDPDLYIKHLKIIFYDRNSRPVLTKNEILRFNYGQGAYVADVELEEELPSGDYLVKVKVDGYLQRAFSLKHIDQHSTVAFPPVNLVAGDLNGNNRLDIIDYHILTGCYSDVLPATFCYPQSLEVLSDLSSDGKVNQKDYNLFMREISVYEKGE